MRGGGFEHLCNAKIYEKTPNSYQKKNLTKKNPNLTK